MRYLLLFLLVWMPLKAEIEVRPDKKTVKVNQRLGVTIFFSEPAGIFPFLSELKNQPQSSFAIVDSRIVDDKTLHITLEPLHTGTLIFAPGTVRVGQKTYLVPALSIECTPVGASLPFAGLLPLYPEKRIDLSLQNRLMLLDKKVLDAARKDNETAFSKYSLAWNSLGLFFGALAVGALFVWFIIYYHLLDRAKRPPPVLETAQERLVKEPGWQTLINALREALTVRLDRDFYQMSLVEAADTVAKEEALSAKDKELLVPFIQRLGAISYAGQAATSSDLHTMINKFLKWSRP